MFRITFINFFKLQKQTQPESPQFTLGLIGINWLSVGKDYLSLTLVLFNFGVNFALYSKNYISWQEREAVKERTLKVIEKK